MITKNDINYKILDEQFSVFTQFLFDKTGITFIDFKHPYLVKSENYKYDIRRIAKERLQSKFWSDSIIGDGEILERIVSAIEIKDNKIKNNLILWEMRYGEKSKPQHKIFLDAIENKYNLKLYDRLFYDFFTGKSKDEDIFGRFKEITTDYRLISYFFFIKYEHKMPIVPTTFDKIFELLGIKFKTLGNCKFDNYTDYNQIIKLVQKFLIQEKGIKNTELLDAHSFLWIIGLLINSPKRKEQSEKENNSQNPLENRHNIESQNTNDFDNQKDSNNHENERSIETIETDKEIYYQTMTDDQFIELYKKQMENGHIGEKIVFESEKNILKNIGRLDLANDVEMVGNQIGLGYDILSYEPIEGEKRIEKQIEVKSVQNTNIKRFYLTRNELEKSRILSNYYVYLVDNYILDNPTITSIKRPDFFDKTKFELKPTVYEIKYNADERTK